MQLNELPDCLLLQIFKRCELKADLWRARSVCKRWYSLLADSELWRVCNLSEFEFNDNALLGRMLNYIPIKKCIFLKINKREIQMDAVEMLLQTASQLKAISMNSSKLNARDPTIFGDSNDNNNDQASLSLSNNLKYVDLRRANGDLSVFTKLFKKKGKMVYSLGVSNNLTKYTSPNTPDTRSFINLLPNLRVLEIPECPWVNDNIIREIASSCSNLKYLNITKCNNVRGTSAEFLIRKCKYLETLILHRTGVRGEDMLRVKWQTSRIKEIDISNCYHLNDTALNRIIVTLAPQLIYLKCAFTNELMHDIITLHHHLPIKQLEFHRRHPLNMKLVEKFLGKCKHLEALDTSLVSIEYETFKNVLNNLPSLKWFNFAGNESIKTKDILKLLPKECSLIGSVGVNFYHSSCDHDLSLAIHKLIKHNKSITKVNLLGTKIDEMYRKTEKLFTKESAEILSNNQSFHLPSQKFEDHLEL